MFSTGTSNTRTTELTDAALDVASGGMIMPPNNSTKLPHIPPTGPGLTTGPYWPQGPKMV